MQKVTRTTYTIDQSNGQSLTLHLEDDYLVIRNYWANGEIESEVNILATVGLMSDISTAISEIENEVIGE
jgi:hypothetical protein